MVCFFVQTSEKDISRFVTTQVQVMSLLLPFLNVAYFCMASLRALSETHTAELVQAYLVYLWHLAKSKVWPDLEDPVGRQVHAVYVFQYSGEGYYSLNTPISCKTVLPLGACKYVIMYTIERRKYAVMLGEYAAGANVYAVLDECEMTSSNLPAATEYLSVIDKESEKDLTIYYHMYAGPSKDFYKGYRNADFDHEYMLTRTGSLIFENVVPTTLTVIDGDTFEQQDVAFEQVFPVDPEVSDGASVVESIESVD